METAVQKLAFEEAAHLRDRMQAMEMTLEKQRAVAKDLRDRDVITIATGDQLVMVNVLSIRAGYLQGSRNFRIAETLADQAELLSTFIRQLYPPGAQCPQEILTPVVPADAPLLEDWFRSEHTQSVKLLHPQRGERKSSFWKWAARMPKNRCGNGWRIRGSDSHCWRASGGGFA